MLIESEQLDQVILKETPFFGAVNKYHGVNKTKQQTFNVMMCLLGKHIYVATIKDEIKAALIFDIASIQHKCLKVKPNFSYSRLELLCILFEPSILI